MANVRGVIDAEDQFMGTAILAAMRSKDPKFQVGACIVNKDKVIVGIGCNGMPGDRDDVFSWEKDKNEYVCHAELNAIMNKNAINLKDCTIYVTYFPCNECAKIICQSGIKEVVYLSDAFKKNWYAKNLCSKKMFDNVGVTYREFTPSRLQINVDFEEFGYIKKEQTPESSKRMRTD